MDTVKTPHPKDRPQLAELHFHLGSSLESHILWRIAHEQGIKLPSKDFWEFHDMVTMNKEQITWDDYHKLFHWTELIQSSPFAMEHTVYEAITGAYRVNNITLIEPLFNPMFRNRAGEQDLDQIILAALRGMERALTEFPQVRAGLILGLDRRLPFEANSIIVRKAIKYVHRGIVGIDIAGPHKEGFFYKDYTNLYRQAQEAGLKTTAHTGEEGTVDEMEHVLKVLPLDRINHGFKAVYSKDLMKHIAKKELTLCLCPTSNLKVGFIQDGEHLKEVIQTLWSNDIKFCINTDNPSMLRTSLVKEINLLRQFEILDEKQIQQTIDWAFAAAFVPKELEAGRNLYL